MFLYFSRSKSTVANTIINIIIIDVFLWPEQLQLLQGPRYQLSSTVQVHDRTFTFGETALVEFGLNGVKELVGCLRLR